MKKFKYLAMAFIAAMVSFSAVSCDDDDDDDVESVNPDEFKLGVSDLTETDNQISFTYTVGYEQYFEAIESVYTFQDDSCISYVNNIKCSHDLMAEQAKSVYTVGLDNVAEIKEINSKNFTVIYGEGALNGVTKEVVKLAYDALKDAND